MWIFHGVLDLICPYSKAKEVSQQIPSCKSFSWEFGGHLFFAAENGDGWMDKLKYELVSQGGTVTAVAVGVLFASTFLTVLH